MRFTLSILFIFIFMSLACSVFAESIEVEAESKITEVIVYPRSALTTRVSSLKLKTGDYKVIFPNIIPEVDENSLRVSASGEAIFKLLGAQLKREFLTEVPSEEIKQLEEEIQNLEDEVKSLQNLKNLLLEKKDFLDSIRLFSRDQIPKDLITKMPTPEDLDKMLKFLDSKLKENYSQIMEAELSIREKRDQIGALKKQLGQIQGPVKKLKRSIVVELQIQKPGNLALSVSYLVRGASWQPIYDARAFFEKSEVELVSYGIVKQKTGEEWPEVEIYLSTAKPTIGGRMPYIAPWFLRPYQPRIVEKRPRALGAPMYQMEALKGDMMPEEEAKLEVPYAQVEEKGVAVVYKLPRKTTIKPDGSDHKLPISSQDLPAEFKYSTYPRASSFAYLGSRVTNSAELQLLAGRVNIFLEGDFVGTSSIDNIGPGEEFDLYLGVDENVKIKRELLEKKVDETLIAGIPSRTKRTTFKYKLSVENYKSKKINLKLFEAMPVSQDERIKVKINDVSLQPLQKDWEDRKGIWLWELELKPKGKQVISYTLIIEHPREMSVEGL